MHIQHRRLHSLTSHAAFRLEFPIPFYLSAAAAGDMGPTDQREHPVRERLLRSLTLAPETCALVQQTHSRVVREYAAALSADAPLAGDGVFVVAPGGTEGAAEADAPVAAAAAGTPPAAPTAAAVTVADCMPIGVYEHHSGSWALLHSGRRGTGILAAAVAALREALPGKTRLSAVFGPCISVENYPVDRACADDFAAQWGSDSVQEYPDGPHIDLRAANLGIARTSGLSEVIVYDDCTASDPRLGSCRREGAGNFTRMLAVAGTAAGA